MTQDNLRNLFIDLHEKEGITYKYFARKIGISPCYFSLWINGNRQFSEKIFDIAISAYRNK